MYKHTIIFYPHIVKQYDSIAQFITDNGYEDYVESKRSEIVTFGFDLNDTSRYIESLSEDGFEGKTTVVFDSEEHYNLCIDLVRGNASNISRKPIFEEEFLGESTEHLI
jgi:glutaredoxin 2